MSERDQTRLSSAVTLALGISLWAQLFWSPLSIEFAAPSRSVSHLAAYFIPLLIGLGVTILAHPVGRLFVFPVSFLPGLAMMPEPDMATLSEPLRLGLAGMTLAGYVVVGAWGSRAQTPERSAGIDVDARAFEEPVDDGPRRVGGLYPGFWWVRGVFVVGLLAVILWGTLVDPAVTDAMQQTYGGRVETARTFLVVFGFFLWTVLVYAFFYRPLANLEYDIRRLRQRTVPEALDRWPIQRRMITWVALGGVAVILTLSLGGTL